MFSFTIWRQQVSSKKRNIILIFFSSRIDLHAIYRVFQRFGDKNTFIVNLLVDNQTKQAKTKLTKLERRTRSLHYLAALLLAGNENGFWRRQSKTRWEHEPCQSIEEVFVVRQHPCFRCCSNQSATPHH